MFVFPISFFSLSLSIPEDKLCATIVAASLGCLLLSTRSAFCDYSNSERSEAILLQLVNIFSLPTVCCSTPPAIAPLSCSRRQFSIRSLSLWDISHEATMSIGTAASGASSTIVSALFSLSPHSYRHLQFVDSKYLILSVTEWMPILVVDSIEVLISDAAVPHIQNHLNLASLLDSLSVFKAL